MPNDRRDTNLIACRHFAWRLFRRDGVCYADGRGNAPNLGKHSLGTRDREEALTALRRLDHAKAVETGRAEPDEPAPASSLSIADGWRLYLDDCGRAGVMGGVSPRTLKRYRAVRDKHLAFCARHGIESWNEFGKPAFQAYGNTLAKAAADRTVYFELTLLKSALNALIELGRLPAACRFKYRLSKPKGTDRYCYRPEEVRAMLEYCAATPGLSWLRLVILGLATTGMRIGELAGLRWSDLDAGLTAIRIADERASRKKRQAGTARTTKGKASRSVPVHLTLRDALATLDRSQGGPVFRAPRGGKLRPNNVLGRFVRQVVKPLSARFPTPDGEVGFADGRLHSFRHFFISQALLRGATEG
ncbi:MAG TPA: tyrosine-type recombinase/integrase, partial [Planctomycetaceae bacterium]